MREVDLAVFPNRCEGGTNLVAMECMACGVPVVLSRNTGHLDLITEDDCYPLDLPDPDGRRSPAAPISKTGSESSIDEMVSRMEEAYTDRGRRASARRKAGAAFMQSWDWSSQGRPLAGGAGAGALIGAPARARPIAHGRREVRRKARPVADRRCGKLCSRKAGAQAGEGVEILARATARSSARAAVRRRPNRSSPALTR